MNWSSKFKLSKQCFSPHGPHVSCYRFKEATSEIPFLLVSLNWPLSGNCIDFSIAAPCCLHLSSMFSVDCDGSHCFAPDSLVSGRLFLIPCRAAKYGRFDFIHRLSVHAGFSGKKVVVVVVVFGLFAIVGKCRLVLSLHFNILLSLLTLDNRSSESPFFLAILHIRKY